MKVEARDVEELLDELIQAMRLLERDAGKAGALLHREIGGLLEKREIAHHARERRLEVVGEVGDEVIFAARLVAQGLLGAALALAHAVEGALHLEVVAVEALPVVAVLDQAVDEMGGDDVVGLLLAARIAEPEHGAARKVGAAHGDGEQKAAPHKEVIEPKDKRGRHASGDDSAHQEGEKPRGAAQDGAAPRGRKPIDQKIAHKEQQHKEQELLRTHHGDQQHKEHRDGKRTVVQKSAEALGQGPGLLGSPLVGDKGDGRIQARCVADGAGGFVGVPKRRLRLDGVSLGPRYGTGHTRQRIDGGMCLAAHPLVLYRHALHPPYCAAANLPRRAYASMV